MSAPNRSSNPTAKKRLKLKPWNGKVSRKRVTKAGRPQVPADRRARPRSLSVRDEQWERWRMLATQRGMTMSALVAYCIESTFADSDGP